MEWKGFFRRFWRVLVKKMWGFLQIFVDKAGSGVVELLQVKSRKAGQNAVIS